MWENFAVARIQPLEGSGEVKVKIIHLTSFKAPSFLLFFFLSNTFCLPKRYKYSQRCCILGFIDWKKKVAIMTHIKEWQILSLTFFCPLYSLCLVHIDLSHHYSKLESPIPHKPLAFPLLYAMCGFYFLNT